MTNAFARLVWPRGDRDDEPPRTGFWLHTRQGHSAHIQGDPNMSQETLDALAALVDAAHRAIERGELGRMVSHGNPHEHSEEATDDTANG